MPPHAKEKDALGNAKKKKKRAYMKLAETRLGTACETAYAADDARHGWKMTWMKPSSLGRGDYAEANSMDSS